MLKLSKPYGPMLLFKSVTIEEGSTSLPTPPDSKSIILYLNSLLYPTTIATKDLDDKGVSMLYEEIFIVAFI